MTAYARDKITKENIEVPTEAEFEAAKAQINTNKNNITTLQGQQWKSAGNVSPESPAVQLAFSSASYSTMLILTTNNSAASLNNLYVIRKTAITQATPNPDAWRIGGAASTASESLIVQGQYGDPPFVTVSVTGGTAAVFYQLLN